MWENLPYNITWAPKCKFLGNDIRNFTTRMPVTNQCIWNCQNNAACTHFVYSNGVCFLKKGPVKMSNAILADPYTVCGINNLS